jgi:hypothetical protein
MQVPRPTAQRACVRTAALVLVVVGLAGCASERLPGAGSSTPQAPYIGVFSGEFVDGKPLYRFPAIEVVGSRRSLAEPRGPDGS